VRESITVPANFYTNFREWLDNFYSVLDEDTWKELMDDDADVNYAELGNGIPQEVVVEDVVQELAGNMSPEND